MEDKNLNTSPSGENNEIKRSRRRRRYLIDTHAQGRFLTMTLLYLIIFSFLLITMMVFPSFEQFSEGFVAGIRENLAGEKGGFIVDRFIPALFIYLLLVSFHSLIMTHRIFGPIYRIEQRMLEIVDGDLISKIHFRKNDFLRGLDISINKAIDSIGGRFDELIVDQNRLLDHLDHLLSGMQSGTIPPAQLAVALKAIQRKQEESVDLMKSLRSPRGVHRADSDLPTDRTLYL
jgi:hypothetical protein